MEESDKENLTEIENSSSDEVVLELQELGQAIKELRLEISKFQNEQSHHFELTASHDELESIIQYMALATNRILDQAEIIDSFRNHFDTRFEQPVSRLITQLYEACVFQDLCGQRIHKIIRIIRLVESDIESFFSGCSQLNTLSKNRQDQLKDHLSAQLLQDLFRLSLQINQMKQQLQQDEKSSSLGAKNLNLQNYHQQFNLAKNEINEIIQSSGEATHTILNCVEQLVKLIDYLVIAEDHPPFIKATTKIFEACAFHDLMGQRMTKIAESLTRLDRIFARIFNIHGPFSLEGEAVPEDINTLSGPQLRLNAPTQDIIDAIFKNSN